MKPTPEQIKELQEKGKVELPIGTLIKRPKTIKGYFDVGKKRIVKKNKTYYQYYLSLNKKLLEYLHAIDSIESK